MCLLLIRSKPLKNILFSIIKRSNYERILSRYPIKYYTILQRNKMLSILNFNRKVFYFLKKKRRRSRARHQMSLGLTRSPVKESEANFS